MAGLARVLAGICAATVPIIAQQAHVNLDWAPQKNTQGLKPYGASLISPEVRDDHTITFRVKAPEAQRVELTGGPMLLALQRSGKNVPFTKGEDGVWALTVGPVKPNMYVYKLVIDGATVPDPSNTLTGFADQPAYSTVVVHGDGPAYYDARNVPHGAVTRHVYRSEVTNGERELYVYTPPGYDRRKTVDAILWATGFRPAVNHLGPLHLRSTHGGIQLDGTTAVADPRVQLVSYGPSASTIGANRAGRAAAVAVARRLRDEAA